MHVLEAGYADTEVGVIAVGGGGAVVVDRQRKLHWLCSGQTSKGRYEGENLDLHNDRIAWEEPAGFHRGLGTLLCGL